MERNDFDKLVCSLNFHLGEMFMDHFTDYRGLKTELIQGENPDDYCYLIHIPGTTRAKPDGE